MTMESRSFGPLALDDLPAYIATSIDDDDRDVFAAVLDAPNYICVTLTRPASGRAQRMITMRVRDPT